MAKNKDQPYKALGSKIKNLRQQWNQSIGEVCTTLEIDEFLLKEIESGRTLPQEELLNLLISHFLLTDDQAEDLRTLAFSQTQEMSDELMGGIEDMLMKQIGLFLPIDSRVIYTDQMNATVNKHGVTLQFMQSSGKDGKPIPVSQVGMSREHAERMIEVLRKTLDQHDRSQQTKMLPAKTPKNQK